MALGTSLISFVLTGCACALFIITSLSTPVNRQISLVHIKGTDVTGELGVLGACYTVRGNTTCTPTTLGYTLPTALLPLISPATNQLVGRLTSALILNLVAGAVGGVAFLASLVAVFAASRVAAVAAFSLLLLGTLGGLAAFAVDLALALVLQHRLASSSNGAYSADMGAALWISVAGIAAYLAACVAALLDCCRGSKKGDYEGVAVSEVGSGKLKRQSYRGTY